MMQRWHSLLERIDALNQRERIMLFASLLLSVLALSEVLWLSPVQKVHKQLVAQLTQQNTELQHLRDDLRLATEDTGPGKRMREDMANLKIQIAEVDLAITQIPSTDLDDTPLSKVLIHFLRRHEGLVLLKTATLQSDGKSSSEVANSSLKRQGLELSVAGSYPELVRYVQTLERSLPALRWGAMKIVSDKQPVVLTLQVSLVGVSR